MALAKELIDVPFIGGLDQKTDNKRGLPTKMLALENANFNAPGKLQKRNGGTPIATGILGGGSVAAGSALMVRGNELLLADGSSLYSWNAANSTWVNKGTLRSVTATAAPLALNDYSLAGYDTAVLSGLQCSVFEKWSPRYGGTYVGAGYSITDTTTGQVVATGSLNAGSTNAICPKVIAAGGNFLIFYIDNSFNVVRVGVISPSAPDLAPAEGNLTSGTTTSALATTLLKQRFDVCTGGSNVYLVFNNRVGGTNGTTIFQMTAAAPTIVANTATIAATDSSAVCVFYDGFAGGPVVGYLTSYVGAQSAGYAAYGATLGAALGSGTLESIGTFNYSQITGIAQSSGSLSLRFFYSQYSGYPGGKKDTTAGVRTVVVSGSYAVGAASSLVRGVTIASKPFVQSSTTFLPVVFDTSDRTSVSSAGVAGAASQSTYFVVDTAARVIARVFPGTAGGEYDNYNSQSGKFQMCPETVSLGGGQFCFPGLNAYRIQTAATGVTSFLSSLFGITLNFSDANAWSRGELANTLHVSGANPMAYDGAGAPFEIGFNWYPYGLSCAGGGTAGSFQYVACYEFTDAFGQVHRSSPSVPLTVSAIGAVTVPTLRLTERRGTRSCSVVLYRTTNNGTTFYLHSSTLNDPTADSVTLADAVADADLIGNQQLYTTGGVLQNSPPAPLGRVWLHRNRIFGLDSTNPLSVWYTKQVVPGAPVEFSGFQTLNMDPRGGATTCGASLDEKNIIFKADRIFMVPGVGPDSTGGQNDFQDPIQINTDTGCTEPESLAIVPDGLMYKGPKGIYLLGRDLQVSYIGAAVSDYNAQTITSAVLMPTVNQVRFTLSGGPVLVYDYLVRQWGVSTGINAVDSVLWRSAWAYLTSAGVVTPEGTGFTDNGGPIALRTKSAWISLAKVQGYQRVYKILILGTFKSAHTLTVNLYYDFGTTPEAHTFTVAADPAPYQLVVKPRKQKCEALQVEIIDTPTGGSGESCDLSGLGIEVGLLRGAARRPAAQVG